VPLHAHPTPPLREQRSRISKNAGRVGLGALRLQNAPNHPPGWLLVGCEPTRATRGHFGALRLQNAPQHPPGWLLLGCRPARATREQTKPLPHPPRFWKRGYVPLHAHPTPPLRELRSRISKNAGWVGLGALRLQNAPQHPAGWLLLGCEPARATREQTKPTPPPPSFLETRLRAAARPPNPTAPRAA
jgi:hypothetical protein